MRLSDVFQLKKNPETKTGGADTASSSDSVINRNVARLNRQIKAFSPGQTIQGEVISKSGSEVQLKLADDMVLSARLEREVSVDLGKIMTFEVKNNGSFLALSPLFENMATDANVMKALEMANIPVNPKSVEVTEYMMKQGMPIDKNTMQSVFRDIALNPNTSVLNILQLHQMNLPVTAQNLGQIANYNAQQHQIVQGMNQIIEEIPIEFQSLIDNGQMEDAIKLYIEISNTLSQEMPMSGELLKSDSGEAAKVLDEGVNLLNPSQSEMDIIEEVSIHSLSNVLDADEETNLVQSLKTILGTSSNTKLELLLENIQNGSATTSEVLQTFAGLDQYSGVDISKNVEIAKLFSSKEYSKILKHEISSEWFLKPEAVDKKTVEELYQKVSKQLSDIKEAFTSITKGTESAPLKSITNLQQNIDFMNQVNQMYTYVQLPLKMNGKDAHGDLYVYTNKKNLAQKDGNVTALLHLDMDNLGSMDIYVAMQNQKVNTKFYLENDEMIDFIEKHIHILNERLEKKGYSMNCEMLSKEESDKDKSMIQEIIESEKNISMMSHYAFDVRA